MLRRFVPLIFFATALGCGSEYNLVPVKGKVMLDGKPLVEAGVVTQPIGKDTTTPGPGSGSVTDANGEFELALQHDESIKGAVPGEHRIRIHEKREARASSDDTAGRFRHQVPEEYRDGSFTYTIPPEGTDQMIIEIDTKKRR